MRPFVAIDSAKNRHGRHCRALTKGLPGHARRGTVSPGSLRSLEKPPIRGQDLRVEGAGRPGTGHYGFNARVVFSPDGRFLAANEWDATVTIWDAREVLPN